MLGPRNQYPLGSTALPLFAFYETAAGTPVLRRFQDAPTRTDLFRELFHVAEAATERRLGRRDSAAAGAGALLPLQLHPLVLGVSHLRLCLLPLAVIQLVSLQRLQTHDITTSEIVRERGRLKMREWIMRYGQKCKNGKCRSRLAVWKAEPILYSETASSYFLKIVLRLLSE